MSTLERIAYFRNRRDEVPNQELARDLAEKEDQAGIQEIAENLWHKNPSVRSDCIKVLYETAYVKPELIAVHVNAFLRLLDDKENRMVWGAMIALGSIAHLTARQIWSRVDDVICAVDRGSLITVVWGVRTLAQVAAANKRYRTKIWPCLMAQLDKCIPRDVPTHAASMLDAVDKRNRDEFLGTLAARRKEMTPSQQARLKKVLKDLENR
jgi:hypothetical protein